MLTMSTDGAVDNVLHEIRANGFSVFFLLDAVRISGAGDAKGKMKKEIIRML